MSRIIIAAALGASAILAAGCGAHAAPPAGSGQGTPAAAVSSPSPSPSINYQQQYLTDVGPYNRDATAFNVWLTANPDGTWTDEAPLLANVYNDLIAEGRALLQQSWPANAQTDVHALALAEESEASDILPADVSAGSVDMSQFDHDAAASAGASEAVRADLGLPPSPQDSAGA